MIADSAVVLHSNQPAWVYQSCLSPRGGVCFLSITLCGSVFMAWSASRIATARSALSGCVLNLARVAGFISNTRGGAAVSAARLPEDTSAAKQQAATRIGLQQGVALKTSTPR